MSAEEGSKESLTRTIIPAAFVLLWSSGFVVAKQGLAYAEPLTFLFWRFLIAAILMSIITCAIKSEWPKKINQYFHVITAGVLVQIVYFGACWISMDIGVNAGTLALIVSMQPIITVIVVSPLLGERITMQQGFGFLLGFVGVGLVIVTRFGLDLGPGLVWCFIALFGMTIGTIYQKKYCCDVNTYSGLCMQLIASAIIVYPLSIMFETGEINWAAEFIVSLLYVSVFLSLLTVGLLDVMLKKGEASRVTSLFFLVPPCASVLAFIMLDESLGVVSYFGMLLCAVGVALVMRKTAEAGT